MRDTEDKRQEFQSEVQEDKRGYKNNQSNGIDIVGKLKKKLRNSRIVIGVLGVLLIASIGFIIFVMMKEKKTEEAFFNNIYVTEETYRLTEDLGKIVSDFSVEGYTASVKTINGYEYLALTTEVDGEQVDICYQNEFPDAEKKDSLIKALINKNGDMITLPDSYDINNPAANLPYKVNFEDGTKGFVFMDVENGMPSDMRLYNISNMTKYGDINMTSTIRYYFSADGYKTPNTVGLSHNGIEYMYLVDDALYTATVEKQSNVLEFADGFTYEIDEDSISFTAYISFGGSAYAGEYKGEITFNSVGFDMSYQRFAAYVPFNYEDPGDWPVITPRTDYLTENITIAGKNGGYYALPLYENVPLSEYDYSRVTEDEAGIRTYTDENGNVASEFGLDVSKFQGDIDWEAVAAQGVTFVIPRIAYRGYSVGSIVEDEYFEQNVTGAQEAGLDVGLYIFSQAVTVEEGIEEAEYIIDRIKDLNITGPIVFDTEYYDEPADARANLITREERTAITKAFCETIEEAGYKPMVYANTRWLLLGIDWDQLAEYDVWYAYYGNDPILPYDFAMWQYSCEGVLEGIGNYVDMNIMFRDVFNEETADVSEGF
ncbi:MAG: glycoside hydrolase family 25 protein [Lachnospiraceae bacterium]|nr:glycoside hydrolase family 25 protein [Lachnospiraceae bacterium]